MLWDRVNRDRVTKNLWQNGYLPKSSNGYVMKGKLPVVGKQVMEPEFVLSMGLEKKPVISHVRSDKMSIENDAPNYIDKVDEERGKDFSGED